MDTVFVYGQEHCPKCDALKSFLEDLGVPFTSKDMGENWSYLDAQDAIPTDMGAPVMEIRSPIDNSTEFYTHHCLFQQGRLDTGLVETILGCKLVTEWE